MADDHSTGNVRQIQRPNERRLTVRKTLYQYPPRKNDPPQQHHREKWVPWLQMKGLWLEQAGFAIGSKVRVQVRPGRLVLTVEKE